MDANTATATAHRMTWYVFTGGLDSNGRPEKIRKTAGMRGMWPGYDVVCTCGFESRTGGATLTSIKATVADHKWLAAADLL